MRIGVVFPQTELGGDVAALRDYAEGVEKLGFTHILAYDHVVGADPEIHRGWAGRYDVSDTFHEPLVMFGYLAAIVSLELVTGILVLPQRPTALVAKQAAEVDVLAGGRFRLGVGIGWNRVEYDTLGQRFERRGRRIDEQIPLLRRFWTETSVTHPGAHDSVTGAGIAPLPVQRPIPIWLGGASKPAFERVGRLADGWFPLLAPGADLDEALEVVGAAAEAAGRDPAAIGMEGRVSFDPADPARFERQVARWRSSGAGHLTVDTMGTGRSGADGHLAALAQAADLAGVGSD